MRIRKNASKLLGSTSVYASTWPPPPPPPEASDFSGIVCELNCSPWDVMLIDNLPNSTCSSSCSGSLTNPKGEDEDGVILGNAIETEEAEPISAAITSTAAEFSIKATVQTDEKKVRKLVRKKRKGNEKAPAEEITYCKKNDGKGWHCKRHAQLPHSFCSYHLAQTRAYSSGHRASTTTDHASEAATAAETRAEGGGSNNLYYYYDGFGPWRGKRRGGRALIVSAEAKEEEKEDGRVSMDRDDDDDNVNVAGDDEYDLDCLDEDDDSDCKSMYDQHNYKEIEEKNEVDELEKKRVVKKRGRKPLKSRSLKSLL